MQSKEAEDIFGDDDNLNISVEEFIDPVKNSLDHNDNYEDDAIDNNNVDPSDITLKMYPSLRVPEVKDNSEVTNVISTLSTINVPDHPSCPFSMFSQYGPQDEDPIDVSNDVCEDPSNASTDVRAEEHNIATDLPPHPSAVPIQYDPRATGLTEAKNSRTASTADEEVFTKQLVDTVRSFLRKHLIAVVKPKNLFYEWPPSPMYSLCTDKDRLSLEKAIHVWKGKKSRCWPGFGYWNK